MQLINLYFKGKLKRIKGHIGKKNNIFFLKKRKSRKVTCYHGNGIKILGDGLYILHKSSDNEIESIKHLNKRLFGIMWHPERFKNFQSDDINLIRNFFKNK